MDDYDSMERFFRGFMVDQTQKQGATQAIAVEGQKTSKKSLYEGTLAGTNGLRSETNGIKAGDEAVKGTAGM